MAEGGAGLIPPVVVTLRAKAGELFSEFGKVKDEIKRLDQESEHGLSRGQKAMHGLEAAGKKLTLGLAGAAVGGAAAAIKLSGNFEEATTQLVTGAGESETKIDDVRKGLLALAPAVGQGPEALAKGMYLVESAGYHGAQGLMVMKAAAQGATVGATDTATVADALTTVLTDYGIKANQAGVVTSKLVATVASGKTTMGDLAGSLHNVVQRAASAGVGLNQVLGAMATMTSQGISADQASQDLANAIQSLENPTQGQTKEMQQLGLSSSDISHNLGKRGLTGTLGILEGALAKHMHAGSVWMSTYNHLAEETSKVNVMLKALPPSIQGVAKQYAAGTITSKEWRKAMRGMNVEQKQLAQQFAAGVNRTRGFNSTLTASGPSAQTFGAALAKLTGGATGMNVALAIGGAHASTFAANVKNLGHTTTEAGGNVKGFSLASKDFNFQLSQLSAAAQALAIKVGDKLIPVIMSVVGFFKSHHAATLALAAAIGGIMVLAIGAYILKLARAAKETVTSYGKMIKSGYEWLAKLIAGRTQATAAEDEATAKKQAAAVKSTEADKMMSDAQKRAAMIARETAAQQAQAASLVAESQASMATAAAESAAAQETSAAAVVGADEGMATAAETTGPMIETAMGPIGLAIGAIGLVAMLLMQHWKQVWGAIKDVTRMAWNDVLKPVFGFIMDVAIKPMMEQIKVLRDVWNTVWSTISSVISAVWNDGIKPVFDFIKNNWKLLLEILGGGLVLLITHWKQVWHAIETVARAVWNDVLKPVFHFIYQVGIQPVVTAIGWLSRMWTNSWNAIGNVISSIWNGGVKPIFDAINNDAIQPIASVIQWFGNLWNSIWNGIGQVIQDVWNWMEPIINTIKSAFDGVMSVVHGVGHFIGGVGHAIGSFLGFATGGPVPGPAGRAVPAIVHGGEYMLSTDMLSGKAPIDPAVVGAVMANASADPVAAQHLSKSASYGHGPAGALLGGGSGGSVGGSGGGGNVIVQGSVIDLHGLFQAMQTAALRHGTQNAQTWAPFKRG